MRSPRPQARRRRNSEFFNRPMCAQGHPSHHPIVSFSTDTTDQKTNPPSRISIPPTKTGNKYYISIIIYHPFESQSCSKLRRLLPALGTMMARQHFASQVPSGTLQGRLQVLRAGGLKRARYGLYVTPPHSEEVLLGLGDLWNRCGSTKITFTCIWRLNMTIYRRVEYTK